MLYEKQKRCLKHSYRYTYYGEDTKLVPSDKNDSGLVLFLRADSSVEGAHVSSSGREG